MKASSLSTNARRWREPRRGWRAKLLGALLTWSGLVGISASASGDEPPTPPETPAPTEEDTRKADARNYFQRGVELHRQGAIEAALAEFIRSRELFPTKNATNNAAICFQALGRHVEALDMYDKLIAEFPDLSADLLEPAERARKELRQRVGTIALAGGEFGATVFVDDTEVGNLPLSTPIRVAAGTHVIRIYKSKFLPFEKSLNVAGAVELPLEVHLVPLIRSGQLRIVEKRGATADVYLDGIKVGQTPWEGAVSLGAHSITLRSTGNLGTQPSPINVTSKGFPTVEFALEALPSSLRIEVDPPHASVLLDGAQIPLGAWEGRVRAGIHTIDATAVGYPDHRQEIEILPNKNERVFIKLQQKPSVTTTVRGRPFLEAKVYGALTPSLHGEIAEVCTAASACREGLVGGGGAFVGGGYRLSSGLSVGLSLGYVGLRQTLGHRTVDTAYVRYIDDTLSMHGFSVGLFAGYTRGDRVPYELRLGTALVPASVGDQRTSSDEPAFIPAYDVQTALFAQVQAEARVGIRLDRHLDLFLGLESTLFLGLQQPVWNPQHDVASGTNIFTFDKETMVGRATLFGATHLMTRYTFD